MTAPQPPHVEVSQMAQDAANALWAEHGPWKLGTINAVTLAFARFEAEVRTAAEAASRAEVEALEAEVARLKRMLGEVQEVEKSDPLLGLENLPYVEKIRRVRACTGLSLMEARALVDRAALNASDGEAGHG